MYTLIFSKDRPAQLDLLLQSMARFVTTGILDTLTHVVYRATTPQYDEGYQRCGRLNPTVIFTNENSIGSTFHQTVTHLINDLSQVICSPYLWVLVDDCVVRRRIDLYSINRALTAIETMTNKIYLFSTRLGREINYCYAEDKPVKTASYRWFESRFIEWNTGGCQGQGDWSYPASLDGTIFPAATLKNMINGSVFNNPNTLETMLAERWPESQGMLAYEESCVVGIPHNKVQDAGYKNRVGSGSAEELNRLFLDGKRIREDLAHDAIIAAEPNACHLELPLERFML